MKTNYLFFIMFCIGSFFSCSNEDGFISQRKSGKPLTKAIVYPGIVSTSNPDLINNWENIDKIILNNTEGSAVTTPWKDSPTSYLTEEFRKDIKKEDGWVMFFHTFKAIGLDKNSNYMVFYNKLTGMLKLFYYFEGNLPLNNGFM